MVETGDIVVERSEPQGAGVENNPFPQQEHTSGFVGFVDSDEEAEVYMANGSSNNRPFIVRLDTSTTPRPLAMDPPRPPPFVVTIPRPVVVRLPAQPVSENMHAMPWNYQRSEILVDGRAVSEEGVTAITRSGRVAPEAAHRPEPVVRGKEIGTAPMPNVSAEEVNEFLKLVKKSEYTVMEQLNKVPAQISLLGLLLTSELHREAVLRILNEACVPKDISANKLATMVGSVLASNTISFSDDELMTEGRAHNKALFVSVRCEGRRLSRVLLDNGSALNICPLVTLDRLGIPHDRMRESPMTIRGFDGAKRQAMGEIDLVVEIGPAKFRVTCQVLTIAGVYNMLLGRPWIHAAGAIPSSLHQAVKFIYEGRLITVFAEDDHAMLIRVEGDASTSDSVPIPFLAYDVVNVSRRSDKQLLPWGNADVMMAAYMLKRGYRVGGGLGRRLQGIPAPLEIPVHLTTFGLGFHPNERQKRELRAKREAERRGYVQPMVFPPLRITFPRPAGTTSPDDIEDNLIQGMADLFVSVIITEEPEADEEFPLVDACQMTNWMASDLPTHREFR